MGTVKGDLHDIGKKLVSMIFEGGGWEVIDLGVDVPAEKFLKALQEHPKAAVGMSALLTTTMINMEVDRPGDQEGSSAGEGHGRRRAADAGLCCQDRGRRLLA